MRVEIQDCNAHLHVIDTMNPALVGKWFAEWAQLLMSANTTFGDCHMRIWPSTYEEGKTIGQWDKTLTQDNLLELAGKILAVSGELEAE